MYKQIILSELYSVLKSKKGITLTLYILLLPVIDFIFILIEQYGDYIFHKEYYIGGLDLNDVLHPAKAAFLSGSSIGHISQMLLIWLLPIILLVLYCDKYVYEKNNNYLQVLFTRANKKVVIISKYIVSFILPFLICITSLTINFILCILLFFKGKSFEGMDNFAKSEYAHSLLIVSIEHPYIMYMIYIFIFSICAGICGIICNTLSLYINTYKWSYTITFVLWFLLIVNKYSITYIFQPFIEYGLNYILPILIVYIILGIIAIICGIHKINTQETY